MYVFDNGSTDATWNIVLREAETNSKIIPWQSDGKPFHDGLRGEVFNRFRGNARDDDWWCRLDADEEYVDDPKEFLSSLPRHQVVWASAIEYYIAEEDVARMDFSRPIEQVLADLRWYQCTNSEPRFFRHRDGLDWGPRDSWPGHMGIASRRRIRLKHYTYRSPVQSQVRLDTRRDTQAARQEGWTHWQTASWQPVALAKDRTLHEDRKDGTFVVDEHLMPRIEPSLARKFVKYAMHGLGIWP
jgi:hypothetical protein